MAPPPSVRRIALRVPALVLGLVLVGCSTEAPATRTPSDAALATPGSSAAASAPTDAIDPVGAMAVGAWRANPVQTGQGFASPYVAGCRAAEPALAGLAPALVAVRGAGVILVVFAGPSGAYLCQTRFETPDTAEAVARLAVPAQALADDGINIALYTSVRTGDASRTLLVGRVGPVAALVIAGFDDETYIFGSHAGGWYAMWWPSIKPMASVAATNSGHVVLSAAHATLH